MQVSQIWGSTPAPVQQPSLGGQSSFGAPFAAQQPSGGLGGGVQPFAAPQQHKDVSAIFQSLGIDTNAAPPPQARGGGGGFPGSTSVPGLGGFPSGLNPVGATSAAAFQQPFMNGGLGGVPGVPSVPGLGQQPSLGQQPQPAAGSAQGPSAQSLMSLLQQPSAAPGLNTAAFAPLGNGAVSQAACGSRAQAAFSNPGPAAPQCQVPQNGLMGGGGAFAPNHAFAPPQARGPPGMPPGMMAQPARPAPPKTLSSAADYSSAAANYKAPPTRTVAATTSISRKPEMQAKGAGSGASPARAAEKEWECPRCTFLNNSALWECEMCGFEHAGKAEPPSPSEVQGEDDGWLTASRTPSKPVPQATSAPQSGKSKAQSKNEKRRAKKRGEP